MMYLKKEDTICDVGINTAQQYIVHIIDDCEEDQYIAQRTLQPSFHIKKIIVHKSAQHFFNFIEKSGQYNDVVKTENHLIIVDMHMPDMNGIELLKIMRTHPLTEDTPTVLLTGDQCSKVALEAYQNKATAILHKPLRRDCFENMIANFQGYYAASALAKKTLSPDSINYCLPL